MWRTPTIYFLAYAWQSTDRDDAGIGYFKDLTGSVAVRR
jgi:hypothetical protein